MTNKEYIENNNISFSDAMKMWDNETYPCINDWLNQKHHKFKAGDFVVLKGYDKTIGIVIDVKDYVYIKNLKRDGTFDRWEGVPSNRKYHRDDHDVWCMCDEDSFEKIF